MRVIGLRVAGRSLHRVAVARIHRDRPQGVDDVVGPHLAQPVQQGARVLQHHPRLGTLIDELGDELAHSLVAPAEHRCVVVITNVWVSSHKL